MCIEQFTNNKSETKHYKEVKNENWKVKDLIIEDGT
jgi:hypothetical protein